MCHLCFVYLQSLIEYFCQFFKFLVEYNKFDRSVIFVTSASFFPFRTVNFAS